MECYPIAMLQVQPQVKVDFNVADIIKAAGTNGLTYLAFVSLLLAGLFYYFLKDASYRIKLTVLFILLGVIIGAVSIRQALGQLEHFQALRRESTTTVPPPRIEKFMAEPHRIRAGEKVNISWRVRDADQVELVDFGIVDPDGQEPDTPSFSQTYFIEARNNNGAQSVRSAAHVEVQPRAERPTAAGPAGKGTVRTTVPTGETWKRGAPKIADRTVTSPEKTNTPHEHDIGIWAEPGERIVGPLKLDCLNGCAGSRALFTDDSRHPPEPPAYGFFYASQYPSTWRLTAQREFQTMGMQETAQVSMDLYSGQVFSFSVPKNKLSSIFSLDLFGKGRFSIIPGSTSLPASLQVLSKDESDPMRTIYKYKVLD